MTVERKTVHIIIGATASGKSRYALEYAQKISGEIINADSMQIYKEFPILSAQPPKEDKEKIPHHLYGFLDIKNDFNVQKWINLSTEIIKDCWARNVTPIFVGGTGFYIQSLINGLSPIPEIPESTRQKIKQRLNQEGADVLYAELKTKDPKLADKLKPNDSQRICRALEVFDHTKRPLSYWQTLPKEKVIDAKFKVIDITKDRKELYKIINARVHDIIKSGALDEVKAVHEKYLDITYAGQRILGYAEIRNYLTGVWTLEQAIEKLQQHTRNYAKRQMTWFRHQIVADISV